MLIENLTPGTTYNFFVQAYDAAGNGSTVQSVSFAVPATVPTPTLADGSFVTPTPSGKSVRNVSGVLLRYCGRQRNHQGQSVDGLHIRAAQQ